MNANLYDITSKRDLDFHLLSSSVVRRMKKCYFQGLKRCFSTVNNSPKICVVGSGPAGFYAAQHLLKHVPAVTIDIYEKLPVPFGLVRFGVAPDHPEVKNVINTFTKTAQNPNVNFMGNINLGTDVRLRDLQEAYHVVLLTYGAEENRKLMVPGEQLKNVIPARNIVGWYNGIPSDKDLKIDLSKPMVSIFGQGNVAVDVARILLTPIDVLKQTDITQHALESLMSSKIKEVQLVGRRGPLQAAFTIKELREMLKLPNCKTLWNPNDFIGIKDVIPQLARPRKRLTELMMKSLEENSTGEKIFRPMFFRSPVEFSGTSCVEKVKLAVNTLVGDDLINKKAISTNKTETLLCDLAVTSIGYKSIQADPELPFDDKSGIVRNENGVISNGLYATGWLGTGPAGVILNTMSNAFAIAEKIASDIKAQNIQSKPGSEHIKKLIKQKDVQMVTWEGWNKIDKYEQELGTKLGKPREKITDIKKMLEIVT